MAIYMHVQYLHQYIFKLSVPCRHARKLTMLIAK